MKNFLYILIFTLISINVLAEEKKCSKFDKLTKDYAKCIADKSKSKVDQSLKKVGLKQKINKFKNSKTLVDLFN